MRWAGGVLLGLSLGSIVSCSSGKDSAASGDAEVEFWTMQLQPQFTEYFEDLIVEFEADNPGVTVRWTDVPWADMQSKILTAVSAGTAPDVVNLNPDFASQLATRNAWLDLGDRVPPDVQSTYLPKIWQATTLNGQSFGIPWYLTTNVTIYNEALLEQAGLEQPPTTYEELADAAQAIKAKTGKYAFFITFVPEDSAEVLQSLIKMGVPLVDDKGAAAFNTPAGQNAFQYWVDLYQQELLPREVLTQGHRRGIDLYQSGETAMVSTSPQFMDTIARNAPDISAVSAAAPQITSTGAQNVAAMNLVIPQATDQPEAALDFALFVTNEENQLAFAKAANVLPSTQASLKDGYFSTETATEDSTPSDKARMISAQQMEDAQVLVPAMENVKQLQKILYENLQAAMLGQKSVEQALTDAETQWNQVAQ
ncbi:MAG: sugar ABC transporter substrate-binding protein [Elainellaceae cyanobacterium]